mmetsp:Transcript_14473/g.42535  ORF Transcript_14473/g.42535 Transcript_14473/m.42535 type:complete len:322 (+) Transcript_14473:489-1454(+)
MLLDSARQVGHRLALGGRDEREDGPPGAPPRHLRTLFCYLGLHLVDGLEEEGLHLVSLLEDELREALDVGQLLGLQLEQLAEALRFELELLGAALVRLRRHLDLTLVVLHHLAEGLLQALHLGGEVPDLPGGPETLLGVLLELLLIELHFPPQPLVLLLALAVELLQVVRLLDLEAELLRHAPIFEEDLFRARVEPLHGLLLRRLFNLGEHLLCLPLELPLLLEELALHLGDCLLVVLLELESLALLLVQARLQGCLALLEVLQRLEFALHQPHLIVQLLFARSEGLLSLLQLLRRREIVFFALTLKHVTLLVNGVPQGLY